MKLNGQLTIGSKIALVLVLDSCQLKLNHETILICLTQPSSRYFHFAPSEEALIYDLREIFIFIYFLLLNLTFY